MRVRVRGFRRGLLTGERRRVAGSSPACPVLQRPESAHWPTHGRGPQDAGKRVGSDQRSCLVLRPPPPRATSWVACRDRSEAPCALRCSRHGPRSPAGEARRRVGKALRVPRIKRGAGTESPFLRPGCPLLLFNKHEAKPGLCPADTSHNFHAIVHLCLCCALCKLPPPPPSPWLPLECQRVLAFLRLGSFLFCCRMTPSALLQEYCRCLERDFRRGHTGVCTDLSLKELLWRHLLEDPELHCTLHGDDLFPMLAAALQGHLDLVVALQNLCQAFEVLELAAVNLYFFPWRKEFSSIKVSMAKVVGSCKVQRKRASSQEWASSFADLLRRLRARSPRSTV